MVQGQMATLPCPALLPLLRPAWTPLPPSRPATQSLSAQCVRPTGAIPCRRHVRWCRCIGRPRAPGPASVSLLSMAATAHWGTDPWDTAAGGAFGAAAETAPAQPAGVRRCDSWVRSESTESKQITRGSLMHSYFSMFLHCHSSMNPTLYYFCAA